MPRKVEPPANSRPSLSDVRVHEQAAAMTKARNEARKLLDLVDAEADVKQGLRHIVETLTEGRLKSPRRRDSRRRRRSVTPPAGGRKAPR
jgi:hypothetical protein